jgi:hypothetical protein
MMSTPNPEPTPILFAQPIHPLESSAHKLRIAPSRSRNSARLDQVPHGFFRNPGLRRQSH